MGTAAAVETATTVSTATSAGMAAPTATTATMLSERGRRCEAEAERNRRDRHYGFQP
jgi:hypothetical protein